jgi:hypothetical protein
MSRRLWTWIAPECTPKTSKSSVAIRSKILYRPSPMKMFRIASKMQISSTRLGGEKKKRVSCIKFLTRPWKLSRPWSFTRVHGSMRPLLIGACQQIKNIISGKTHLSSRCRWKIYMSITGTKRICRGDEDVNYDLSLHTVHLCSKHYHHVCSRIVLSLRIRMNLKR